MKIAYNQNDTPWGQDGCWIGARDGETLDAAIARDAAKNAVACVDAGDGVDALAAEMIDSLTIVDLSDMAGLDDWESLSSAWQLARRNGWTSDASDILMLAEIRRREDAE